MAFSRMFRVDKTDGTVIYQGEAVKSTDPSSDAWSIKRMILISDVWVLQWADGDVLNDNIWDNRLILEYS